MSNTTSKDNIQPPLLKESEVSKVLGVARRTLAGWRGQGRGPSWVDLSGGHGRKALIRYPVAELQKWIQENLKK